MGVGPGESFEEGVVSDETWRFGRFKRVRDADAWVTGAQHAAPLRRESIPENLFDDDAQEFLFAGAEKKADRFA